jgi:hypothetical protein
MLEACPLIFSRRQNGLLVMLLPLVKKFALSHEYLKSIYMQMKQQPEICQRYWAHLMTNQAQQSSQNSRFPLRTYGTAVSTLTPTGFMIDKTIILSLTYHKWVPCDSKPNLQTASATIWATCRLFIFKVDSSTYSIVIFELIPRYATRLSLEGIFYLYEGVRPTSGRTRSVGSIHHVALVNHTSDWLW